MDFSGKISLSFISAQKLQEFCMTYVPGFDPARLQVSAIRLFSGNEFILTLYAVDKHLSAQHGKKMVKKFKLEHLAPSVLVEYMNGFNFTVSDGSLDLDHDGLPDKGSMEVINK
jgi:hypothetical protein